jgi:hypothetical protein
VVRKSAYQAGTGTWAAWETVDDFEYASGWDSGAQAGFAHDSAGNIYVAGYAENPSTGIDVWIVRESSNAGTNWSTVDVYQYDGYSTPAIAIASSPAGVFVAGYADLHWIVRQTTNAGQTWSIADNYVYPNATASSLGALTVDTAGNIYTAGAVTVTTVTKGKSTTQYDWVVRKGIDGGTSWSDVLVSTNTALVYGMGSDATGNVYVVGGPDWVVWKGTDAGTSWSVADSFLFGSTSEARACASDIFGNVYVCGYGAGSGAAGDHWLVRETSP